VAMTWPQRLAEIQAYLMSDGVVQLVTYTQARNYTKKHVDWFSANETGLYVQQGKRKECLNFSTLRFGRKV